MRRNKVFAYLSDMGMPIVEEYPEGYDSRSYSERQWTVNYGSGVRPLWNGEVLRARSLSVPDLFHEFAHWLVQPKTRHLPNYGLGLDSQGGTALACMSHPRAYKREQVASLLGIAYLKLLALPWAATAESHNWEGLPGDWPSFVKANPEFKYVQREGHVYTNGLPRKRK